MSNLEFIEESHQYLYDGVLIPSVSEIIGFKFGNIYQNIPKRILNNKANYGTKMHELVDMYFDGKIQDINHMRIDPNMKMSLKRLDHMNKTWNLDVLNYEQKVCFEGRYAGTYDLLTKNEEIVDIKTTQKLHLDNKTLMAPLNIQISLYYMAYGLIKDHGYCLWMPKGELTQLVLVKTWKKDDLLELLEEFENAKKQEIKSN